MRILLTGGTGFIGSNLTKRLVQDGHDLIITGNNDEQQLDWYSGEIIKGKLSSIDWESLGKFDVVFHQAAINDTTLMDREEMFSENVLASKNLFNAVYKNGCRKIVYASSTAVYGDAPAPYKEDMKKNPLNPYAESKLALDEFAMQFSKDHSDCIVIGLRYCNVYGPGESHKEKRASMIYQLAQQMNVKRPRIFKFGEQKRDYIYVKDVVRANLLAATAKQSCIVNCGSGSATTFNDVIKILNENLGTTWEPEYFDNPYVGKYQDYTECDMTFAKEKIGFVPAFDTKLGIKDFFSSGKLIHK